MYLSKLLNMFVQIDQCICLNYKKMLLCRFARSISSRQSFHLSGHIIGSWRIGPRTVSPSIKLIILCVRRVHFGKIQFGQILSCQILSQSDVRSGSAQFRQAQTCIDSLDRLVVRVLDCQTSFDSPA